MEKTFQRNCPKCNKTLNYKIKYLRDRLYKRGAWCRKCAKNNMSDETKHKMSISQIGHRNKLGYKCSVETKKKISDSKIGEKNPAKQQWVKDKIRRTVISLYEKDPNYKIRISEAVKKYFKEHPESLERPREYINQYTVNYYTDIEGIVKDILESFSIQYEHNKQIGRYWADFLIFNNIVLECDGEYWHDPDNDIRKTNYLIDKGYKVYRFSGTKILKETESVKSIIKSLLI